MIDSTWCNKDGQIYVSPGAIKTALWYTYCIRCKRTVRGINILCRLQCTWQSDTRILPVAKSTAEWYTHCMGCNIDGTVIHIFYLFAKSTAQCYTHCIGCNRNGKVINKFYLVANLCHSYTYILSFAKKTVVYFFHCIWCNRDSVVIQTCFGCNNNDTVIHILYRLQKRRQCVTHILSGEIRRAQWHTYFIVCNSDWTMIYTLYIFQ